jgi:hypothetical protein
MVTSLCFVNRVKKEMGPTGSKGHYRPSILLYDMIIGHPRCREGIATLIATDVKLTNKVRVSHIANGWIATFPFCETKRDLLFGDRLSAGAMPLHVAILHPLDPICDEDGIEFIPNNWWPTDSGSPMATCVNAHCDST